MNILIIGNGFDLAHKLQTSYQDFLRFTEEFKSYNLLNEYEKLGTPSKKTNTYFYKYFRELFKKSKTENERSIFKELETLIENNIWLEHFKNVQIKSGWIDFESEISQVVQQLEEILKIEKDISSPNCDPLLKKSTESYFFDIIDKFKISFIDPVNQVKEQKDEKLRDLDKLIRCLEIYLSDYINKVDVEKKLLDIDQLPPLDKVLSFNYTNTFERVYKNDPLIECDYIHGKADIGNSISTNNMVLGIDEYLKGEERNENIEFIAFKKFYQRIHKETGCLYKDWITEIKADNDALNKENIKYHNLFIFGHSLDITDRDVLRDLILNDNVQTKIFYKNKEDYGKKIANLVRVLGQDELIKRTGGRTKTITFRKITEEK